MLRELNDDDIRYAEGILFGREGVFDAERREYIRHLGTCDLQAVPGSGKTTALLAKLLILEKYLPLESDRGILVISHTNAAVNEINARIGAHCPRLFGYPNFVGTIQSFVDQFLAVPYFNNKFKKRVIRIDNEIYSERMTRFSHTNLPGFSRQAGTNAKYYLNATDRSGTYRLKWEGTRVVLTEGYNGRPLTINRPRSRNGDWTENEKNEVRHWLIKYKLSVLKEGCLCYDDAYFLAERFIMDVPRIINLLRSRFRFVFVDEMQDMERHQYDLLEQLFGNGESASCHYQRIGDKNQAIFGGKAAMDDFWVDRDRLLQLTGSHRLNPSIAAIVERFAVSPIQVRGLNVTEGIQNSGARPHIFVYDDATIRQVIPTFAGVIGDLRRQGMIPDTVRHVYKAVAWTTESEDGKIRLDAYFEGFSVEEHRPKIDYLCLDSYLTVWDREGLVLEVARKNIVNSMLRVLRMEGLVDRDGRPFNQHGMIDLLSATGDGVYRDFRLKLYKWSIGLIRGNKEPVLGEMRAYMPELLRLFGGNVSNSRAFLNSVHRNGAEVAAVNSAVRTNIVTVGDIEIDVTTVHSTKGQTHTATLYLESFYQKGGGGNYESERLAGLLKGVRQNGEVHALVRQSMKMVYVGFSRPTHLLGFAVHRRRFDCGLSDINRAEWEIVEV